ncbi:hypothetical protein PINS_up013888 [Pythium insidiosum]|nr:hypothetical protein PINS_up013888 [Pythium insidiosum]
MAVGPSVTKKKQEESSDICANERRDIGDVAAQRRALLERIASMEKRGAILPSDAHTLRNQVNDCTSGQWREAEERLKQLAMSWNPYQDYSAEDRREKEREEAKNTANSATTAPPESKQRVTGHQHKRQKQRKKDFYELLQLSSRDATSEEIKKQFRRLALQLHPDKQIQASASSADNEAQRDTDDPLMVPDSTEFARLRLAYETLNDPEQRAAYDAKLIEQELGGAHDPSILGVDVKNQIALEAASDFASLEWMARVKHKMDVMDRIAEWAKLLGIRATDIRFETGEPCVGRGCGKIVSMDRDLECYGSPRRRVYVCLLHKYIHACDESCTSRYGDTEMDKKVCTMRAFWLVQNWLFDHLALQAQHSGDTQHHHVEVEETKEGDGIDESNQTPSSPTSPAPSLPSDRLELVSTEIHLGDYHTKFAVKHEADCKSSSCRGRFRFLEEGILVCSRHGTPHVCTYEQCDRKELRGGQYICWASGQFYGFKREIAGTGTRTRKIVYTDRHGESTSVDMEVPTLLPFGQMGSYLLEDSQHSPTDRGTSFSPPPPGDKVCQAVDDDEDEEMEHNGRRAQTVASYKRAREEETSPTRARIRRRLVEKVRQADASFYIYLKIPRAVANLPKVALEVQEHMPVDATAEGEHGNPDAILPIRVRPRNTLNYIKYFVEELSDQQISIWDQQVFWGDTLIGDEEQVMMLEEHGICDGTLLELRLHEDCPLLVANWSGKQTIAGEYNTVQISKEAEEELDEEQEEWKAAVAEEEAVVEREKGKRATTSHTEVIQFDGNVPRLVGVIPSMRDDSLKKITADTSSLPRPIDLDTLEEAERRRDRGLSGMKRLAPSAEAVQKRPRRMLSKTKQ